MLHHQTFQSSAETEFTASERVSTKSLKSTPSVESFQTGVSVQVSVHELEGQKEARKEVEAVRSVLHAFKTALEVLHKLVEKRFLVEKLETYSTAKNLEKSLTDGETELKDTHELYCKLHGSRYLGAFTDPR